jgi:UDP-glucose:(glucosyl)LPS alpha-1,2-glucosyltransferase
MTLLINELSSKSLGGTELLQQRLYNTVSVELLDKFQIWFSRFRESDYDPAKLQIFYAHDLAGDPESELLADGGWARFHKIIFVSNWQMNGYQGRYGIPPSRCEVMLNSITPIDVPEVKPAEKIKIGYWSTPHRGLAILVPVFSYLAEKYDNIELDVFSSFKLYGWEQRDEPYKALFQQCVEHPRINYHGSVSNESIRKYAAEAHIFAYPSIWPETSCLCLMEAMSARMACVHPNYGALFETAGNWTAMYPFDENLNNHAAKFQIALESAILAHEHPTIQTRLRSQKAYADVFYNWSVRASEWEMLLQQIIDSPPTIVLPVKDGESDNGYQFSTV